MERFWTILSTYDHWILHKKLVLDETFTIVHIIIYLYLFQT